MSEYIDDLKKSRAFAVEMRRKIAAAFIAAVESGQSPTLPFKGVQEQIEAIDAAIIDEGKLVPPPTITPEYAAAVKEAIVKRRPKK